MISVIIPTYNREELLKRSIQSVLAQTYGDIEIIVIDDCSTDHTKEYVQSIDDKRVRYIRLDTRNGAAHAKNVGIGLASGEYVAFQDSDDYWYENKLEKQLTFLQNTDSDVVFCSFRRYLNDNYLDTIPSDSIKEGTIEYEQMLKGSIMSTQTIMGKKECFIDEKWNENHIRLDDWELAIRLSRKFKVSYQKEILLDAFIQKDSISTNPLPLFDEVYRIYETYQKEFSNEMIDNSIHAFVVSYKNLEKEYNLLVQNYQRMENSYQQTIQQLENNYQQVLNSSIWKLTKPIRKILDLAKGKK